MDPEARGEDRRRLWIRCAAIFAVALALKVAYVLDLRDSPFHARPIIDEVQHDQGAQEILARGLVGEDAFYFAPLYPYLLAGLYATVGRDLLLVKLLHAAAGAANVVVMYLLGRRAFRSEAVGGLAALLTLGHGLYYFYEGFLLKATLAVLLTNVALLLLLRGRDADRRGRWAAAGLVVGLTTLLRGNVLLLIPFYAAWIVWLRGGEPWRPRLARLGVFGAGVAAAILPATLHNALAAGDLVPTTYQGGTNFYVGNHPGASGYYEPLRPNRGNPEYEKQDAVALAREAEGRDLSPSEVSSHWLGRGLAFWRAQPGAALALTVRKLGLYLNTAEIPDALDYETYREGSFLLRLPLVPFGLLVCLGACGLSLSSPRWREMMLLYLHLAASVLSVVLFFVFARYRLPTVSVWILFAAYAPVALVGAWRARERSRLVAGTSAALVLGFLAFRPLEARSNASHHVNLAAVLQEQSRFDEAITELETALALDPDFAPAHFNLALVHMQRGELDVASEHIERAAELNPTHPPVQHALGSMRCLRGDWRGGVEAYRRALELQPDYPEVSAALAAARRQLGETSGAGEGER